MVTFKNLSFLDTFAIAVLFLLCGLIGSLLLANITYINAGTFREILSSTDIHTALFLTIITSVITTLFATAFAIPSAYALSRQKNVLFTLLDILIDLLIVVPVLVIGVSILVFFRTGTILQSSDFLMFRMLGSSISFLGDMFIYQKSGIVLTQFFCSVPFAVRVIKSTFDEIDPRTEQVARTLGCTRTGAFFRITLPLAKSGIIAGAMLSWARAFGLFGPVSIVAGAVRQKTEVLSTSIFLEISIGRLEIAITISLLMITIAASVLGSIRFATGQNLFSSGRNR